MLTKECTMHLETTPKTSKDAACLLGKKEDHVDMLESRPPRDSIAKVTARFKNISAKEIFREPPEVKRKLWRVAFWKVGYFARTLGSNVTTETIRKRIKYRDITETTPEEQLELLQYAL